MDTYQQRRLQAALLRDGVASSWRQYLADARQSRKKGAAVIARVHALGVLVDARTLARWTRQAVVELAHVKPAKDEPLAAAPGGQVT